MARFATDKVTRFGLGLRFSAVGPLKFLDHCGCDILHHVGSELSASIDQISFLANARSRTRFTC
jgi:3-hydroxybutyryl-CoA dehydrogenase